MPPADYSEREVTDWPAKRLVDLVNREILDNPSVEIFRRGNKVILRTWYLRFDVSEFEKEEEEPDED